MGNKPSIGVVVFFLSVALTGGYFLTSKADESKRQASPVVAKKKKTWDSFSSKSVGFSKPSNWTVRRKEIKVQNRIAWIADGPPEKGVLPTDTSPEMRIVLSEYTDGKEKRSLEKIYKTATWEADRIHSAKTVLIEGGKCLDYRLDYEQINSEFEKDGRSRVIDKCIRRESYAHCYSDDGRYFETSSNIGHFCNRQNPDERTARREKIYSRFMRSLKFKPIS